VKEIGAGAMILVTGTDEAGVRLRFCQNSAKCGGFARVRTDKLVRIIVHFFEIHKKSRKILKTRGNSNKSGENFISNFNHLIYLILNFVKYVQIGPNGPITIHKFEFLKNNKKSGKICKKTK
jgi:hypothetical protein